MKILERIRRRVVMPATPATRTNFAVLVEERKDGTMSLFVKVTRSADRVREEKTVFTITDRLDPRLEGYLRELADAERARRLTGSRLGGGEKRGLWPTEE